MFIREREVKGRTDVNYYTARRLGDMAESLNQLARAFDDGIEKNGQLTKDDGLAAMQASAALVCDNCSRCNLYADSEKEDSYYLYYLLRAFEQKGHIDFEDMPQMFQSGCRKKGGLSCPAEPEPGKGYHEPVLEEPFPGEQGRGHIPVQGTVGDTGGIFPPD